MTRIPLPRLWFVAALGLLLAALAAAPAAASDVEALTLLRGLAGDWRGDSNGQPASMRFEVTSGGHTVIQTEFPGEQHEMRTVYWLDDGRLVAQHFCMLGNQPRYRVESTEDGRGLRFRFDGGSNLDPRVDPHAHEGTMRLREDGRLESVWSFWERGGPSETRVFLFERQH